MRLSNLISEKYNISKRYAKILIKDGKIYKNSSILKKDIDINSVENYDDYIIKGYDSDIFRTDKIEIYSMADKKEYVKQISPFIIYKDNDFIFWYKPSFIHSQRHNPFEQFCMSDLEDTFKDKHFISRLDYSVDGIMPMINKEIKIDSINKEYLAWVYGELKSKVHKSYSIDANKKKKVSIFEDPQLKEPVTIKPLKHVNADNNDKTLVNIILPLAHRHQVRAVLSYLGHPIVGDNLYGMKNDENRIYLHCKRVSINSIDIYSPFIDEFSNLF